MNNQYMNEILTTAAGNIQWTMNPGTYKAVTFLMGGGVGAIIAIGAIAGGMLGKALTKKKGVK